MAMVTIAQPLYTVARRRPCISSSYWGLIDFRMGTPRLKIQVILRISSSTMSTRNPPCVTASWGEIDQNKELYITQQQKTKPKHSQC